MKKLNFIVNEAGETVVNMVENQGQYGDGSAIEMYNQLFRECVKENMFKSVKVVGASGNGTKNIYCECGDIVLVKVSSEVPAVAVFDKQVIGKDISELFDGKSMCINRGSNGRGIWRMYLPKVRHYDHAHKNKIVSDDYPVAVTTIIWMLTLGLMTEADLHSKTASIVDITQYESHHILGDWDNRMNATSLVTEVGHQLIHSTDGQYSHQIIVNPTSVDEVKALLKYIEDYEV